jgi:hypothetical protein
VQGTLRNKAHLAWSPKPALGSIHRVDCCGEPRFSRIYAGDIAGGVLLSDQNRKTEQSRIEKDSFARQLRIWELLPLSLGWNN